jgi:[histone H3]-lysine9 N-trimethyltransferase SUV39H
VCLESLVDITYSEPTVQVVQHGRKCIVNIVKTKDKGWGMPRVLEIVANSLLTLSFTCLGVFAGPKRIPAGTFVGIYAGELLTEAVGQERGL